MNNDLAQKLEELKQRDIQKRSQLISENRLFGTYDREMQKVHIENAIALDIIVSEYGWTGISLVGIEGCQSAWLIAQHSICTPDLQRKFLKLMTEAAEKREVPKRQVAMLADRIRFNNSSASSPVPQARSKIEASGGRSAKLSQKDRLLLM